MLEVNCRDREVRGPFYNEKHGHYRHIPSYKLSVLCDAGSSRYGETR